MWEMHWRAPGRAPEANSTAAICACLCVSACASCAFVSIHLCVRCVLCISGRVLDVRRYVRRGLGKTPISRPGTQYYRVVHSSTK